MVVAVAFEVVAAELVVGPSFWMFASFLELAIGPVAFFAEQIVDAGDAVAASLFFVVELGAKFETAAFAESAFAAAFGSFPSLLVASSFGSFAAYADYSFAVFAASVEFVVD